MRTIEAHRGWSGSKVMKVNKSVAISIVGSNTLNRKNFSNANILKVKTTKKLIFMIATVGLHVVTLQSNVKGDRSGNSGHTGHTGDADNTGDTDQTDVNAERGRRFLH